MNFGKNNLGGKDEKKGKRKLEKQENKVIKPLQDRVQPSTQAHFSLQEKNISIEWGDD